MFTLLTVLLKMNFEHSLNLIEMFTYSVMYGINNFNSNAVLFFLGGGEGGVMLGAINLFWFVFCILEAFDFCR